MLKNLFRFFITWLKAMYCGFVPSTLVYVFLNVVLLRPVEPFSWFLNTAWFSFGLALGIWVASGRINLTGSKPTVSEVS